MPYLGNAQGLIPKLLGCLVYLINTRYFICGEHSAALFGASAAPRDCTHGHVTVIIQVIQDGDGRGGKMIEFESGLAVEARKRTTEKGLLNCHQY